MRHVCFRVADLTIIAEAPTASGARVLGDGKPPHWFARAALLLLHPKAFDGTLIELEEVGADMQSG